MREIHCPEGRMRKVFIVVLNRNRLPDRIRNVFSGKDVTRY